MHAMQSLISFISSFISETLSINAIFFWASWPWGNERGGWDPASRHSWFFNNLKTFHHALWARTEMLLTFHKDLRTEVSKHQ
jgi:hypothetical protein